jgi:hypothetical protein
MKICINYYGQLRDIKTTINTYNNFIKDTNNEFHILYTTWENENTIDFKNVFKNAFINKIQLPDLSNYKNIIDNYDLDPVNRTIKSISHYILGLYIKLKSLNTIEIYENTNNIVFDIVINIRTDTYIWGSHLSTFYNLVSSNDNKVYCANEYRFDVYKTGSVTDAICFSNRNISNTILNQLNNLEKCVVIEKNNITNFFHPETTFYNNLKNEALSIIILPFNAYVSVPYLYLKNKN